MGQLKNRSMKTILAFILLSARVFNYSSFTAAFVVQPAAKKDASCNTSLVKSAAKRRTVDIFNPVYRSNHPFYANYYSDDMSDDDEEKSRSVCASVGLSVPPCRKNQCCVKDPANPTPRCMAKGLSDGDSCFNNCQCGTGDESICSRKGKCKTIS